MRKPRLIAPMLLGLPLVALPALLPDAYAALPEVQSPAPGMPRYAGGTALATLPAGSEFFHDFPAGPYRFTVQPYGPPTGEADTAQLAAGTQTYLQVNWLPEWSERYPESGPQSGRFFVQTKAPEPAEASRP